MLKFRTMNLTTIMSEAEKATTAFDGLFSPISNPSARRAVARYFPGVELRAGAGADPWIEARSFGVGILKLAGSAYADYDSLVDGTRALDDIWEAHGRRYSQHVLFLGPFVEGDPSGPLVEKWAKERRLILRRDELARAPMLGIAGSWQEYHDSKSGKTWGTIRRKERQLVEAFGPLAFSTAESPEDVALVLPSCMELYRANWSRLTSSSFFLTATGERLLHDLITALAKEGKAEIARLELAGSLVAFVVALKIDLVYYFHVTATSKQAEHERFSVGKIFMTRLLESVFTRKFRAFDFMAGEEPYKFEWTRDSRSRTAYYVVPDTRLARLRLSYLLLARRRVADLKKNGFVRGASRWAARVLLNERGARPTS